MRGSPPIENAAARWSRPLDAVAVRAVLLFLILGFLAGLLTARVRLHPGLPGHRVLFWMPPLVAARLLSSLPVGATLGCVSAGATCLAFGGQFAGSILFLPLLLLSGALLDLAASLSHRLSSLRLLPTLLLMSLAGLAANLVCLIHRLFNIPHWQRSYLGLPPLLTALLSYALFGLLASALATALALLVLHLRRRAPRE